MLAEPVIDTREQEYARIINSATGQSNDAIYASMLSSWQAGLGIIPDDFGLGEEAFDQLLASHFPGLDKASLIIPERSNDERRSDECDEVYKLLLSHRANLSESEIWMARIVAIACQGQDHLWQDMGLWSRSQLSELLMCNFASLASKNINNMKWKKFLYKQLCITEGIYTCRAPSCEVCSDYHDCFTVDD